MSLVPFLHRVANRENLSAADAREAMEVILTGQASTAQVAAFLTALRMKGEAPEELLGFARAMRDHATAIPVEHNGHPLVDTCGTGGAAKTFNISTITAFVIAGAGVRVAKHGNRSMSGLCGSADILEALGVNIHISPDRIAACIREVGIGFMFAPAIHPAMKHAQPARAELKMRTAFNLLGPLTNPARATVQLVGAPGVRAAELMAEALASLGLHRGFVVHGIDGTLDEITTTGETLALEIRSGVIAHHTLTPKDFGVRRARIEDLAGGDIDANCKIARAVLGGEKGPRRDVVLVNSSAALVAAARAADFDDGMRVAAESIDSGAARAKLDALVAFTTSQAVRQAVSPACGGQ
jgi:anthranilate phosphoribosyltransferase